MKPTHGNGQPDDVEDVLAASKRIGARVIALHDQGARQKTTGQRRYTRFFPEKLIFLLAQLQGRDLEAYLRLLAAYAVHDGNLPDDDRTLAQLAGLSPKAWAALREKLLRLRFADVADGRWIDHDQNVTLELQRRASARARAGAAKRWGSRQWGEP